MKATIEITDEVLEKLLKFCEGDHELQSLYWQLRGVWIAGGDDDQAQAFISDN